VGAMRSRLHTAGRRARWVGLAVFLGVVGVTASLGEADFGRADRDARAGTTTRPNVLIIVVDDQSIDELGFMPSLKEWFASGGATFSRAFVTTPLCCPSRSTIFSGRYAHNHRNTQNGRPFNLDQTATLQKYLHDAGYRTAMVGKFLTGWSIKLNPPNFDLFTLTAGGYYGAAFRSNDGWFTQADAYSTHYVAQKAVEYVDAFESRDAQPWMLYVAPHAPHRDFTSETQYADTDVGDWAGSPAVFEGDRSDKPPYVRRSNITFSEGDLTRRQQLRTLLSVDDMIEAIFTRLRLHGEASNTLAIFTSDNGFLHGEHGLRRKAVPYTKSIRVPFFVRWPGRVAAGVTDKRLVANVDIAPSVLAATAVPPALKYPLDGKALLSPTGLTTANRERLFIEYFYSPDFANVPAWRALRTGTFQYIETYDSSGTITFREYYDLAEDPWQNRNLLADGDPTNNPPTTALATSLRSGAMCKGVSCP
jgi:arylsulfatase A-like enzyme